MTRRLDVVAVLVDGVPGPRSRAVAEAQSPFRVPLSVGFQPRSGVGVAWRAAPMNSEEGRPSLYAAVVSSVRSRVRASMVLLLSRQLAVSKELRRIHANTERSLRALPTGG